jgi:hypothetical protein
MRCEPHVCSRRAAGVLPAGMLARRDAHASRHQESGCKFACYMWEGYRRHTGPELHTGGMRGSKFACWQLYVARLHNGTGTEFGHTIRHGSKTAGFSSTGYDFSVI